MRIRASARRCGAGLVTLCAALLLSCSRPDAPIPIPVERAAAQRDNSASLPTWLNELRAGLARGDPSAKDDLALRLFRGSALRFSGLGWASEHERQAAFDWIKSKADAGDSRALVHLALLTRRGVGTVADEAKSLELLAKADSLGDPLGEAYTLVLSRKEDKKTIARLIEIGDSGFPQMLMSAARLGLVNRMSAKEVGGLIDRAAASSMSLKDESTLAWVAGVRETGDWDKKPDAAAGHRLYSVAWELGCVECAERIGAAHLRAKGLPRDSRLAVEWFQRGADAGSAHSREALAWEYYSGDGVLERSDEVAFAWANLAKPELEVEWREQLKHVGFSRLWADLNKRLRPEQMLTGEKLSRDWFPGRLPLWFKGEKLPDAIAAVVRGQPAARRGSAFFVTEDGHAATNWHVITQCRELKSDQIAGEIKVLASDQTNDVAILTTATRPRAFSRLRSISDLVQGEAVYVFGFPLAGVLSSQGSFSSGNVTAMTGPSGNVGQFQFSAPIQPGSSGGPVIDRKGAVVGMAASTLDPANFARATGSLPQNVNFAASAEVVVALMKANGVRAKSPGWLSFEKRPDELATHAREISFRIECRP